MTKRERALLMEIYECLNAMTGLTPSNPANTSAIFKNIRVSGKASQSLALAVFHLVTSEPEEFQYDIEAAQTALGIEKKATR